MCNTSPASIPYGTSQWIADPEAEGTQAAPACAPTPRLNPFHHFQQQMFFGLRFWSSLVRDLKSPQGTSSCDLQGRSAAHAKNKIAGRSMPLKA